METTITLPFAPNLVWGTLTLLGIALASALTVYALPKDSEAWGGISYVREKLGLQSIPVVIFLIVALLWVALALLLLIGLFGLIIQILINAERDPYLFYVLRLAGLTTVLGAVIALPFTIIRLRLNREQTKTAKDSLFNEKINAATQGLYARRQVTKAVKSASNDEKLYDFWEDDVARRNAAITQLKNLVAEDVTKAKIIAQVLGAYLRTSDAYKEGKPE